MLLFNVTDIVWEIDEGYDVSDLPTVVNVSVPESEASLCNDVDEYICEYLSDMYGCLVSGFHFTESTMKGE